MLKPYDEMIKIDVRPYCKKRDGLDYLNWATCIKLLHENGAGKGDRQRWKKGTGKQEELNREFFFHLEVDQGNTSADDLLTADHPKAVLFKEWAGGNRNVRGDFLASGIFGSLFELGQQRSGHSLPLEILADNRRWSPVPTPPDSNGPRGFGSSAPVFRGRRLPNKAPRLPAAQGNSRQR